jgi:hypothetical protein
LGEDGAVSEQNVETIRRFTERMRTVWASAEPWLPLLEEFCEPDLDYYPVRKFPGTKSCHGVAEFAEFLTTYRDAWDRIEWDMTEVVAVGDDRVYTRGTLSGEGSGSGATVGGPLFICYWLRHGRIFREEDHLTEEGARRAFGLSA